MTSLARTVRRPAALALALPLALLAGCGDGGSSAGSSSPSASAADTQAPQATEEAASTPRLALTYDGGIQVLDATTLEVIGEMELDGFNRLNAAGDGRHVLVSTTGGFQVLDAGTWATPHGDHDHYYTADPVLTDVMLDAETPGHVVVHEGRTALFDDGTGEVVVLDSVESADGHVDRELTLPAAHHGVAVELMDGTLVVSEGAEEGRTGVRALDADDQEIASIDTCPGVHGEAMAADEAVVIGCEDGVVIFSGGTFTKVQAPDAYGRIGNQAGSEASSVVLGDYKTDEDAELERPTRVSLTDTATQTLTLVDLPASYSFRSLGRGEDGEALLLGTDGALHVIDPTSGAIVRSVPVVQPWEEPIEWQEPRPTLHVLDGTAYVTEPASNMIHAVDVQTGEVWNSVELTVTPNELNSASGAVEHGAEHAFGGEDEHDHEDDEDEDA